MKKKKKQKVILMTIIFAFIFPIMVKALSLNSEQMTLCVVFYGLIANLISNFNFEGALLTKLSIIT